MVLATDIGSLIVRSPDIRNGRARITGTGVTVSRVVSWYKLGLAPEDIVDEIGHVTLAQVYAALAYYHSNKIEVETEIANEDAEAARLEQQGDRDAGTRS
jgi:uncharacterized protein (DUF433 family)